MRPSAPALAALLLVTACGEPKETGEAGETMGAGSSTGGASTQEPTTAPVPTTAGEGTTTAATNEGTTTSPTDDTTDDTTTAEPVCVPGTFITRATALEQVRQDLQGLALQAQPFTRYISLVHLHNAGLCEEDIAPVRQAVGKLLNALSSEPSIEVPAAIDGLPLVLRIDLRDYGWQDPVLGQGMQMFADTWEMVAGTNPHAISFTGDAAAELQALSGTKFALLQADALVAFAALAPLYYDALRLPDKLGELEAQLGVVLEQQIEEELTMDLGKVARAAMRVSQSADFNRVIERHELPNAANRALWRTHDFAGQAGQQNVFTHPLDFDADVSQVLFTLPNGLHGYMIADANGDRLDEMPLSIERDPLFTDQILRPGMSCMGCHTTGLIKTRDDLRFDLDNGTLRVIFDEVTKQAVRDLYPPRPELDALLEADIASYSAASALAGSVVSDPEPVSATFLAFDAPVELSRAAAELWVTSEELQQNLGKLAADLAPLAEGPVPRSVFSANFAAAACQLAVAACP